jgi:hypothetical protein
VRRLQFVPQHVEVMHVAERFLQQHVAERFLQQRQLFAPARVLVGKEVLDRVAQALDVDTQRMPGGTAAALERAPVLRVGRDEAAHRQLLE